MTHYMGLLAANQPWNLIIFMAIPVIFAETIAITELYILFTRNFTGTAKKINSLSSIFLGVYFTGIFVYLMINAVVPVTMAGEWKGFADVIAVGFYLLGAAPLIGMALLELGWIQKNTNQESKLRFHAICVGIFLVVAHVAMIFGMVNPDIYSKKISEPMQMEQGSVQMNMGDSDMQKMMNTMTSGLNGKTGDVFDKEFLEEMIVHHEGAIEMSKEVLMNSKRPELIKLANNIISAQTNEIEMMKEWQKTLFK